MASVHVVIAFDRTSVDTLVPCEAVTEPTAEAAAEAAKAMVSKHAGAVAFTRKVDPATGESGDGDLIVSVGEVDLVVLKA